MNPRSRSEPAFIDIAFSMAALPARISSGVGGVQIGCHHVMAIPHCAIAHFGSRPFIEKRVKQRHATSEIRLDVRRARYRERDFPDAPQIARFGSGCAFGVTQDEQSTDKRDETHCASRTRSQHSQGYLPITIPANCKIISLPGHPSYRVILSEAKNLSS